MAGKVEELYIKVVARAGEAKKELENLKKIGEKAQKPIQDEINKLKEFISPKPIPFIDDRIEIKTQSRITVSAEES